MTPTAQIYNCRTDATLSPHAKQWREAFLREYIKDFDGQAAMSRIGATQKNLTQAACNMLREPYVASRLSEILAELKEDAIVSRSQVLSSMWREANDDTNAGKTRVQALAHIGKMLGMFLDNRPAETSAPIGVMLIPVTSVEDWQTAALTAQAALKAHAISPVMPPPRSLFPTMVGSN